MKILYVDDDELLRQFFCGMAKHLGHDYVVVDDGARAWEVIQSDEVFDLIISDYNMPKMNGLEFLKQVRGLAATKNTPFILLTSNDDPELRSKTTTLGAVFEPKSTKRTLRHIIADNLPSA